MKHNVTINLKNRETGELLNLSGKIWFEKKEGDYGNGYHMIIKGLGEPFWGQGYDIRYDKNFKPNHEKEYITYWYSQRRDWELAGIDIQETEE